MEADALDRWRRARRAFDRLFDMTVSARTALLAQIGRDDPALADDLRQLMANADLEADADDSDVPGGALCGAVVGDHFRLLRLLGAGGMGEVYLASRTDDIDQHVALKVVRSDLPATRERARRERQILGRLTHPNIAGLIDAGIMASGRPWFAMDYVDGERITDWCDHHCLDLAARARLCARVCRGVQFAHRNLVLHRDVKPSNILVDSNGTPKLLDFGIAKILEVTDDKQTQTLALTPAYASPEQLRGDAATTASDIYQLGLVLYELLGGVPARRAREIAPSRPHDQSLPRVDIAFATATAIDGDLAQRIARARSIGIDRLRRSLKGDLGRIVAKATAVDIRERYDTAQALADDLDRWADGLPVVAYRGSLLYRMRKLIRRHSVAAAVITALALGLVGTSVVAVNRANKESIQRRHAEEMSRVAEELKAHAEHQREVADEQRKLAQDQRQRAETLLEFMNDVFRQIDPQNSNGEILAPAQILDRAGESIGERTDLDVLTRAALDAQIADTFNSLFLPEKALRFARRALDIQEDQRDQHPDDYLASAIIALDALEMLDDPEEQIALVEHALPLAQEAGAHGKLRIAQLLKFRGAARCSKGDFKGCSEDLKTSIRNFENENATDSNFASSLNQLAVLVNDEGDIAESARLLAHALAALSSSPRALRADIETLQQNLNSSLILEGRCKEAIPALTSALRMSEALYGADARFHTALVKVKIARCRIIEGNYAQARTLLDDASRVLSPMASDNNTNILKQAISAELALAKLALDTGSTSGALIHISRAFKSVPTPSRGLEFSRLRIEAARGEALLRDGRCAQAVSVLEPALSEIRSLIDGSPSWISGEMLDSLGRCALTRGEFDAARKDFDLAAAEFRKAIGPGSPSALRSEAHALWAEGLATRNPRVFDRIEKVRSTFVKALGNSDLLPIWQLDLLADDLASSLGDRQHDDQIRLATAKAGLKAVTGTAGQARFAGISGFN